VSHDSVEKEFFTLRTRSLAPFSPTSFGVSYCFTLVANRFYNSLPVWLARTKLPRFIRFAVRRHRDFSLPALCEPSEVLRIWPSCAVTQLLSLQKTETFSCPLTPLACEAEPLVCLALKDMPVSRSDLIGMAFEFVETPSMAQKTRRVQVAGLKRSLALTFFVVLLASRHWSAPPREPVSTELAS
jgi:hypothetical protein